MLFKNLELNVPEFSFVQIKKEHTLQTNYPFHYFDNLCFGSKFSGDFKEVDKLFLQTNLLSKDNITGRDTFLKIGLFDIWLCNEDRHYENFNLLYDLKSNIFVPIDHVNCFNGLNLDKERYLISSHESILSSPFLSRFFNRNLQHKSNEICLQVIKDFKINLKHCHEKLDDILAQTPLAWNPDTDFLKTRLELLFSDQWIKQCLDYFTELFIHNIQTKK